MPDLMKAYVSANLSDSRREFLKVSMALFFASSSLVVASTLTRDKKDSNGNSFLIFMRSLNEIILSSISDPSSVKS